MKIGELLELVEEAIGDIKVAIVANQMRSFESPYTSLEFTQRAVELQEDLNELVRLRDRLLALDPETDAEEVFGQDDLEKLLEYFKLLRESKSHLY